jgi:hypothetical protein
MTKKKVKTETGYYQLIKELIERYFKEKGKKIYLEITADKFSNKIKEKIPKDREIIFRFLAKREARPDLTGYIEGNYSDFIVVEIKDTEIKIDDIYQLRKYKDLFGSKFAFLISTKPIPTEIKRVCNIPFHTLSTFTIYEIFNLGYFNKETRKIEWFPTDPFKEKEYLF